MTLQTLLNHCTKSMKEEKAREFLYLLNKDNKTAFQLAKELHENNAENEAYEHIFAELGNLYSAKEKAIEDVVQTLYKQQEEEENLSAAAHLSSNTNEKG